MTILEGMIVKCVIVNQWVHLLHRPFVLFLIYYIADAVRNLPCEHFLLLADGTCRSGSSGIVLSVELRRCGWTKWGNGGWINLFGFLLMIMRRSQFVLFISLTPKTVTGWLNTYDSIHDIMRLDLINKWRARIALILLIRSCVSPVVDQHHLPKYPCHTVSEFSAREGPLAHF